MSFPEEAWLDRYPEKQSVHLEQFPEVPAEWRDAALAAKWEKVKSADPKCQGVGCASDIDPDPFFSRWRYRESDPITKL